MPQTRPQPGMTPQRSRLLTKLPKQGIGVEVGVWKGDFSAAILAQTAPQKLYLIDPWTVNSDETHRRAWYGSEAQNDMEQIHQGVLQRFSAECDSGTVIIRRAPSQEVLSEFADDYFDFVYIDGDHEYSAVRKDCFLAFQKTRVGGYICGDDYILRGWWKDGVVRAFHELIHERPVVVHYAEAGQIMLERLV